MGKIKENGLKFFYCFTVGLLAGVLLGSIAMSILVSYKMDNLYERIAYLESIVSDRDEKLEKLEKSINTSNIVIKDIEIILDLDENIIEPIDNIEIEKAIKEKYNSSLGKEVKNIDADILVQVIDKRILRFNNSEYQLKVSKLVLTEILKLWVEVSIP